MVVRIQGKHSPVIHFFLVCVGLQSEAAAFSRCVPFSCLHWLAPAYISEAIRLWEPLWNTQLPREWSQHRWLSDQGLKVLRSSVQALWPVPIWLKPIKSREWLHVEFAARIFFLLNLCDVTQLKSDPMLKYRVEELSWTRLFFFFFLWEGTRHWRINYGPAKPWYMKSWRSRINNGQWSERKNGAIVKSEESKVS